MSSDEHFDFKKNLAKYLPARKKDSHKGDFGHLIIIGGDEGYSGAVRLAGEAAYRVGAGLVTVLTHPQHAVFLDVICPELMCRGVLTLADLKKYLLNADAIIFGPGLGQTSWSQKIFHATLDRPPSQPMVIDADGLNWLAKFPTHFSNAILTPHPGEAAHLLNETVETIQKNRMDSVKQIQNRYGGISLLKGHHTLIQGDTLITCTLGNPGMATAGTGDVLSGVIGGLLAQQIPLEIAATLGVHIHAMAGDLAATNGERGLMASDLIPLIRKIVN